MRKEGDALNYVLAVLLGAVWGVLCALLGMLILKRCLKKNSSPAMMAGNLSRTLLDLVALAAVFLLREQLQPLPYTFVLVGTAVGLSFTTIIYSFRLAGKS